MLPRIVYRELEAVKIKTFVYIDGFNLYYSALKGTSFRWFNPVVYVENEFHKNKVAAVRYFSARVQNDQPKLSRQMVYWRALRTLPNLEIIEGTFRTRIKKAQVVSPPPDEIEVFRTDEKGSDVNLGAHLLMDGFQNRYDAAVVITGDSDLITPIKMVRDELHKTVIVVNPQLLADHPDGRDKRPSAGLRRVATIYRDRVTRDQLFLAQFHNTLTDEKGTFTKPMSW